MVDRELIIAKADAVKKHVTRVKKKADIELPDFIKDADRQDIVLFNIQMAVQNCLDIAAHIISEEGYGVPGSNNDMFYMLEEHSYLETRLVEKMIKAVGFRNLVVHEYGQLDMERVYNIMQQDIQDLFEYLKAIFKKTGIAAGFQG
jgi:uncharacterized protein YutE (UPF0331/DUF86 family)